MKRQRFWFFVAPMIVLVSCTTSGDGSDVWSRSYFAPRDDVIEAVIDVLEDEGYFVETDRAKGRIIAKPSRSAGDLAALVVGVRRKGDRVLVDVQTRPGASYSTMASRPTESAVLEFFHELNLRLPGGRG